MFFQESSVSLSILTSRRVLVTVLFALLIGASLHPLLADQGDSCSQAASIGSNEVLAAVLGSANDRDYFELDITQGGMLDLILTPLGTAKPRLQFLGKDCGGWSATDIYYVERDDLHHVVHILRPGKYFFRVLGEDTANGDPYEVRTGFVADPTSVDLHLTPVGALSRRCDGNLLEMDLSSVSSRQLRLTKESQPGGGEVVVVSTTEPGRVMIQAGGVRMLGSVYSSQSCSADSQMAADALLNGANKLVLSVGVGDFYLRVSPELETLGTYDLTTAFYPFP